MLLIIENIPNNIANKMHGTVFDSYQNKDLTFFLHRISYTIYGYIWPDSTTV